MRNLLSFSTSRKSIRFLEVKGVHALFTSKKRTSLDFRDLLGILFGLGLLLGWSLPVRAQAQRQAEVDLYPTDASAFPVISTFMDVFDASGRFVSGLKPEQVTILEDGQPLQVQKLSEMVVPAQIAVAINPGPPLGVRDTQGIPRFQGIVKALNAWAQALPSNTPDDLSLVTTAGPIISHASAKDWQVSLSAYQPDFRATLPNLQSLSVAIDTVAVAAPRVGMKRAVFFITPHMDDPNIDTLVQPLIQRAVQNRVHVFVWFTDTDLYAATTSAAAFNNLAIQTGGAYFSATGTQPYPDPDSYFAPLRRVYSLQYSSMATTGGSHSYVVEVKSQAGDIKSAEQPFTVDIQPPNPMFVSPPLQIVRRPPDNDPYNDKVLLPESQKLDVIIEFPDGHNRPLVRTTLYVDGQVVAENKAAPFDTFTWDLSGYTVSGEHKIIVEAVDDLNLSKTSMEIPVTITVIQPPHGLAALFGRYRDNITLGAVAFAGVVLLLILFFGRFRMAYIRAQTSRQAQADPLTQEVMPAVEEPITGTEKKLPRRRRGSAASNVKTQRVEARASLRRLIQDPLAAPGQTFKPAPVSPILLTEKEITFGTDPVQSTHVLDDPSLAPRHARITQTGDGNYLVADAGSIAGTWVNFEPVGKEGHQLQHGDVVNFGQLAFRFELKDPPASVEPKIAKENPES
jgi:hypothetical protein